ncbi:hypothetical protein K466DRAFT_506455 [Polyporus arcularius HHB13444]|uniref:Uncharacterized protein n=1 Tax=Polyporus arcularius HHB13444 TaxID=1314778 RepID=A0A5C3NZP3_9APHY|nr:hypothetical protein K466DRAFT_506455 [Polyporus arcularius HHB13444]
MGRRAKYFTLAERKAAKRAQHTEYARSDRGKATRARLRSKHTHSATSSSPVSVPPSAYARAAIYSVLSWTFSWQDDADVVVDLGLRQPPYAFVLPDAAAIAALEDSGNDGPELTLNSIHCSWIREEGRARFRAWSTAGGSEKDIIVAANAELGERVRAWNTVATDKGTAEEDARFRKLYLDWGAKRIVWLWEELEVRREGLEAYLTARAHSELPTQRLYQANIDYIRSLPSLEDSDDEPSDSDDWLSEMFEC